MMIYKAIEAHSDYVLVDNLASRVKRSVLVIDDRLSLIALWVGLGPGKKNDPSIFLEIRSKCLQVIPSNFPMSFGDARDLVVFDQFLCFVSDFQKITKSRASLNSWQTCLKSPDGD